MWKRRWFWVIFLLCWVSVHWPYSSYLMKGSLQQSPSQFVLLMCLYFFFGILLSIGLIRTGEMFYAILGVLNLVYMFLIILLSALMLPETRLVFIDFALVVFLTTIILILFYTYRLEKADE